MPYMNEKSLWWEILSLERTPRETHKLFGAPRCFKIRFARQQQILMRSSTCQIIEVLPCVLSDFVDIEGVFWMRVGRHMNTISTCHLDPWIDLKALTCSSKGRRQRGSPSWPCDAWTSRDDSLGNSKMRPSHSGVNALVLFSGRWNTHFSSSFEGNLRKIRALGPMKSTQRHLPKETRTIWLRFSERRRSSTLQNAARKLPLYCSVNF